MSRRFALILLAGFGVVSLNSSEATAQQRPNNNIQNQQKNLLNRAVQQLKNQQRNLQNQQRNLQNQQKNLLGRQIQALKNQANRNNNTNRNANNNNNNNKKQTPTELVLENLKAAQTDLERKNTSNVQRQLDGAQNILTNLAKNKNGKEADAANDALKDVKDATASLKAKKLDEAGISINGAIAALRGNKKK